jgi:hAT family C-terminal dimerisation region
VREKFTSAFDEYKREDDVENALGSSEAATNDVPTLVLKNPFKRCRVDKLSEIDRYLEDPCAAEVPDFDVLAWWKAHEADYPILAMMARDLLAIPASSVPSERAFSSSGELISKKRTRLANKTIRAIMCIKEWTRKDFVAPRGGAMVEDAATEPESE